MKKLLLIITLVAPAIEMTAAAPRGKISDIRSKAIDPYYGSNYGIVPPNFVPGSSGNTGIVPPRSNNEYTTGVVLAPEYQYKTGVVLAPEYRGNTGIVPSNLNYSSNTGIVPPNLSQRSGYRSNTGIVPPNLSQGANSMIPDPRFMD